MQTPKWGIYSHRLSARDLQTTQDVTLSDVMSWSNIGPLPNKVCLPCMEYASLLPFLLSSALYEKLWCVERKIWLSFSCLLSSRSCCSVLWWHHPSDPQQDEPAPGEGAGQGEGEGGRPPNTQQGACHLSCHPQSRSQLQSRWEAFHINKVDTPSFELVSKILANVNEAMVTGHKTHHSNRLTNVFIDSDTINKLNLLLPFLLLYIISEKSLHLNFQLLATPYYSIF